MEKTGAGVDEYRFRRRPLPHWEISGRTYFVTFRLARSLPAHVANEWRREYEQLRRDHMASTVPYERTRWRDRFRAQCEKYDVLLDGAGYGPKHLSDPRIAELVVGALRFWHGERCELVAYVVMPNHVHCVVRPLPKLQSELFWGLDAIMQSIKGYTGREANKLLGEPGEFWQREYFDHWIRDEEEWVHYVSYTHQNPVKAGLCARPEEWPWSSAREGRDEGGLAR